MDITAKDIVKIIKACRKSGVSELKLPDMELKFVSGDAGESVNAIDFASAPTDQELKDAEEQAGDKAMFDRADEELAFMQVENPSLFEELLVSRELEGNGSTETEDY